MRFVSKPPLTNIIGCSSLICQWYAFGRTESHEIYQNAFFFFYTKNVLRAIYTTFCILVNWKLWDLSASLRWPKQIGCRSFVYHWYATGSTESRKICQNAPVCDLHWSWLEAVRFVSRPTLIKIIGCSLLLYRRYAVLRAERREICQNVSLFI